MRAPGSNLGVAQPYGEPVDLSATRVRHGSHRAYNAYRCRCQECVEFRRSYERERWETHRALRHAAYRRAVREGRA